MFSFKRIVKSGPQDEVSIRKLIAETEAREVEIKARLAVLADRRLVYLRDDNDAALDRDDAEVSALHRDLDKAGLALADLHVQLQGAQTKAAEVARLARYAEAERLSAAAAASLRRYPALAGQIVSILRDVALAELSIVNANSDLPAGKAPLPGAEFSVRGLQRKQERIVNVSYSPAEWRFKEGNAQVGGEQKVLDVFPDGLTAKVRGAAGVESVVVKRRKRTTQFVPTQNEIDIPQLASRLVLPPLRMGENSIWEQVQFWGQLEPAALLNIISEMQAAAAAPVQDPRGEGVQNRIEWEDVEPAVVPPEVL